ncbi:hypothetical protein [Methylobacterium thuringiense]|uniref:Uncharacterized protein n=1 Tax=Methylobacterium thuringiense TaxID=1003091 RepID=A0ABQ4TR47_9HYPH|nr:hypothetical protein [Methylobacterium thuringiense]GJE57824.1 hypothetical protein EKPJFOCH_4345 [Methylobacterium thuringiense]
MIRRQVHATIGIQDPRLTKDQDRDMGNRMPVASTPFMHTTKN